jgi:hypothetical protein
MPPLLSIRDRRHRRLVKPATKHARLPPYSCDQSSTPARKTELLHHSSKPAIHGIRKAFKLPDRGNRLFIHCWKLNSAKQQDRSQATCLLRVTVPLDIIFRAHMQATRRFAWITHEMYVSTATLLFCRLVSTSTTSCAAITRLTAASALHQLRRAPRLLVSRLHGIYLNLVMRRLAARLLVGWSHCLLPCVRSPPLAARLLVVRIALALLRQCCASRRTVSPLDFSLVGRTGSRRASGDCVSWRDYSSSGLHGSTAPMSCIRTCRLAARLLVSRSHWFSTCARSFRCAS